MVTTTPPALPHDVPVPTVHVRENWIDSWAEVQNAVVTMVHSTVAPAIGDATFTHRYGLIQREGVQLFAQIPRLAIARWFVRIQWSPTTGTDPTYWYGIVTRVSDDRMSQEGAADDAGDQTIYCRSWEWLLTREYITTAEVATGGGGSKTINRGIAFNGGYSNERQASSRKFGNRQGGVGADANTFASEVSSTIGEDWTAENIVDYLLDNHKPLTGSNPIWEIDARSAHHATTLAAIIPQNVETHGRTLYEVMSQVIDRRYGLTWRLELEETGGVDVVRVQIFAYNDLAVLLPSGGTLIANPNQETWYYDDQQDVQRAVIQDDQLQYIQVITEGERRGACFSLSYTSTTLDDGWTSGELSSYVAGTTKSKTDESSKKRMHDSYRLTDAMAKVFQHFVVPDAWDGKVYDPELVPGTMWPACPALDADGNPTTTVVDFWRTGLRFENWIPFDYPSELRKRRPFVALKVDTDEWVYAERTSAVSRDETLGDNGYDFACSLRMMLDKPGFVLDVTVPAHVISSTPITNSNFTGNQLDYEDDMIATVFCHWDEYVTGRYPADADVVGQDGGQDHILRVKFGPRARLDWVAEDTVTEIAEDGTLVKQAAPGAFVRDDRDFLNDMALLIWQWYQTQRRSVMVRLNQVTTAPDIGILLTTVGASADPTTANSMITNVTWHFQAGTTEVRSQFAELDFIRLADQSLHTSALPNPVKPIRRHGPAIPGVFG